MNEQNPWEEIPVPGTELNVRLASNTTSTPCYWARDVQGAYLFIIELEGNHIALFRKNVVTVKGISVDLRATLNGQQQFVLTLDRFQDRDLFTYMCKAMIQVLEKSVGSEESIFAALAHLKRWKAFLAGRANRLSEDEVRGLYSEINFLLELLDSGYSEVDSVRAWMGPEKSHQDFIYGNRSVEVKSISGKERNRVRISSEDQLESNNDLYLRLYQLTTSEDKLVSMSLNELVEHIRERIVNAAAVGSFDAKLIQFGYVPLPEYDEPRFVILKHWTYKVEDEFPRLVRSQMPHGVMRLSYDVALESITRYLCNDNELLKGE